MFRRLGLVGAAAWAASAACALPAPVKTRAAAQTQMQGQEVRRVVDGLRAKGLTDGVVVIAKDGAPVFRYAFGLANREWSIASTPDAEYRIGSITKQFTAFAILRLARDGKLSLDDPISRFITDAPPAWRPITIRHLLTHTSGIPNFTALPGPMSAVNQTPEDIIRAVRDLPLDAPPGTKFLYDNTGYVLLGRIVHAASGQSLGDYLSARVFAPLGMTHTGFVSDRLVPQRAYGYAREGGAWVATGWNSNVRESGAGALYSTAADLLKWDRALGDPKRLGLDDLSPMFTDYGHGYGLGYVIGAQAGHPVQWHNGHVDGFSALLARYPKDRLTIIVLSNDDGVPVERMCPDIAAAWFGSEKPAR